MKFKQFSINMGNICLCTGARCKSRYCKRYKEGICIV